MHLKVSELNYCVDGVQLLKRIGMEVRDGEFVGLIGPNGCGKSTLLKHIYRVYRPRRNAVLLDGNDVLSFSSKGLARQMSVMAQENSMEFDFRVSEMVLFGRYSHHKLLEGNSATDRRLCSDCLKEVGLEGYEERSFQSLSGGEKQRVLLARTLMQQSPLIVLDEPMNHLDVSHQYRIMDVLRRRNATVFSSIHDLNLAALYCDRLILMLGGEIVATGTPEELITPQYIRQCFGIEALVNVNSVTGKLQVYYLPDKA